MDIVRGDVLRQVASCRDRTHLLDVGDMLSDRGRRDEIFFAELRFDTAAVEMASGAVALNAARRTGMSGVLVPLKRLFDCEGIFAVGGGRDRSRQVDLHYINVPLLQTRELFSTVAENWMVRNFACDGGRDSPTSSPVGTPRSS